MGREASHKGRRSSCCSRSRSSGWSMCHWDVSFYLRCSSWSCGGVGVTTAAGIMPGILLNRTRATGFVVVPLSRPTVAIIVAIGIIQATPRVVSRCWGRFFPRQRSFAFKAIFDLRWPGILQCEQVTTAEGVDVTTIADSRPLAFHECPFCMALIGTYYAF